MSQDQCLFCKIVSGTVPNYTVHETETTLAFLDVYPSTQQHTLVIPKEHYPQLDDIPDPIVSDVYCAAKKVGKALLANGADGYNILANNGEASGQQIFHSHVHVIPRTNSDGLFNHPKVTKIKVVPEDGQSISETLSALIE